MRILTNILRTFKVSSRESCKITNRRYSSQICTRIRGSCTSLDSPALSVVCVRSLTTTTPNCKNNGTTADTTGKTSSTATPPSTSNNQIIPVALLKTESEFDEAPVKVLVIPINLFNNDEEAVQKTMSTMSVIRANAEQIDVFTDNASAFINKAPSKAITRRNNSKRFDALDTAPKQRISEEPLWQEFNVEQKAFTDGLDEAIAENEINRIKPTNAFDAIEWSNSKPAYIIADVPANLEKSLGEAGIASMDLAFEMDMTNIKDAFIMREKLAKTNEFDEEFDEPVSMALQDPMISITTSVHTDAMNISATVPLNFNALIQGTVNIDSTKLTPKQIEQIKVPQFNDYVTTMAANICSTALQKGFPTDLSRMYSTKTPDMPKRPKSPHVVCERQGDKGCISPGNADLDPYVPKGSKLSGKKASASEPISCKSSETLLTSTIIGDTGARGLMSCKAYALALKEAARLREVFAEAKAKSGLKCEKKKDSCGNDGKKKSPPIDENCVKMPCGPPKQDSICKDKRIQDPPANAPGNDPCFPQDSPCKKADSTATTSTAVMQAAEAEAEKPECEQQCASKSEDPPCKSTPFKCPVPKKKEKNDQKEWDDNPCRQNYPKQCPPKTSVGNCKRPIVDPCAPHGICPKKEEKKPPPPCPTHDPCKKSGGKKAAATDSADIQLPTAAAELPKEIKEKENFTFKACEAFRKACAKRTAPKHCEAPELNEKPVERVVEKEPKCEIEEPKPSACKTQNQEPQSDASPSVKCTGQTSNPCSEPQKLSAKAATESNSSAVDINKPDTSKCSAKKTNEANCSFTAITPKGVESTRKTQQPRVCKKSTESGAAVASKKSQTDLPKKAELSKCSSINKTEFLANLVPKQLNLPRSCADKLAALASTPVKTNEQTVTVDLCKLPIGNIPTTENSKPERRTLKCDSTAKNKTSCGNEKKETPKKTGCGNEKKEAPKKASCGNEKKETPKQTGCGNEKKETPKQPCGTAKKPPAAAACGADKGKPKAPDSVTHCPNTAAIQARSTKPNCPKGNGNGNGKGNGCKSARPFSTSSSSSTHFFVDGFNPMASLPLSQLRYKFKNALLLGAFDFYSKKSNDKEKNHVDCPTFPPRPRKRTDIKYEKGLKDCFLQDRLDDPCHKPPPKDPKNNACNKKPPQKSCWDDDDRK